MRDRMGARGRDGRLFDAGAHMPAPPPVAESPLLWGAEEHVRELFAGTGVEVEFAREQSAFAPFDSIDDEIEFATSKFGPLIMARRMLEPEGRWQALWTTCGASASSGRRPPSTS